MSLIRVNIATMMLTDKTGEGTAVYQTTEDNFIEFVSGEPCTKCVQAKFTKDRHSICEFMIDKNTGED